LEHSIANALKRRATLIGGKAWGSDKGKPRIYMDYGRKDTSVYFAFPQAMIEVPEQAWDREPELGDPDLKVYIDDSEAKEPRPAGWYNEEKAKVRSRFRMKGLAIMALDRGSEELAASLAEAADVEDALFERLNKLLTDGDVDGAMDAIVSGVSESEPEF
jgi:hypothetical protein